MEINRKDFLKLCGGVLGTSFFPSINIFSKPKKEIIGPWIGNVCEKEATISWIGNGIEELDFNGEKKGLELKIEGRIINHVTLKGLKPGEFYEYAVGDRERKFRTKPNENYLKKQKSRIFIYGDSQIHSKSHKHEEIVEQINDHIDEDIPSFVIHVGDQTEDGRKFYLQKKFLKATEPISGKIPYYLVMGNHERDSNYFFDLFALPGNERYYNLEWGNCYFAFLDSSNFLRKQDKRNLREKQFDFIKKSIKNDKINIAVLHHPLCSSEKQERIRNKRLRKIMGDRLDKMDFIFSGHEHNYQRHIVGKTNHIVTGGGGGNLYGAFYNEKSLKTFIKEYHFIKLDIEKNNFNIKAINDKGKIIDSFDVEV